MKQSTTEFKSILASEITDFLGHQRALGKRFINEERALRLLDRFLFEKQIKTIAEITPRLSMLSWPRVHAAGPEVTTIS